jgi:GAF domain-containing protein
MESAPIKKKVALLGLPDDALDVLTHYTQGSDWETIVVVSPSEDAYAARMADVLGIPVVAEADPEQLAACDLVIVGPDAGVDVETIREILENEPVLVADLEDVSRELSFHPFAETSGEPAPIEIEAFDHAVDDLEHPVEFEAEAESETAYETDEPVEDEVFVPEDDGGHIVETFGEDHIVETFGDDPTSTRNAPPAALSSAAEHDRIDIHGSPDVHKAPSELRSTRKKQADSRPVSRRVQHLQAAASSNRALFDLSGCLGPDPEHQYDAVPLDGESPEFQALLEEVLAATGAQTGSVMLPHADGEHLAIAASIGLPKEIVAATRPPLGEGLAGRAYATGVASVLQGEVPQFAEAAGLTHRVAASIPIQRDGRRMGVLSINIDSREPIVESELLRTLDRFIEPAQRAIFRSVDVAELSWDAQREILFRALDAVMGLNAGFPERLVETGEILRKAVRADFVHVYLIDPLSQRLEHITPARGLSATEGRYLPLDRGFYSWVVDRGVFQLLTAPDPETGVDRAVACLPVRTVRPYGLLVLEHFKVEPEAKSHLRDLLVSVIEQLEDIFEVEQGVESQDVLAGLRMRINDKKNELELLPAALRAQSVLEFALAVLAAEAAVWLEGPGGRPVIAQPQTRQAARIVADVWDSLDTLCGWIREYGSVASGGTGPGWDPGAPAGPSSYIGVRDERGNGVIVIFFNDEERLGASIQLPARILIETLRSLCALIPVESETVYDNESTLDEAA